VLVGCPKCKTRLRIADEKIAPDGTKFKCPKCSTLLLIKPPVGQASAAPKPAAPPLSAQPPQGEFKHTVEAQAKEINPRKVLIAHEDSRVVEQIMSLLLKDGYLIIPASNGIEAQTQAMKELPFLAIVDAALPRVTGYELLKRFKGAPLARDIKGVILTSVADPARSPQGPAYDYGAIAYLDVSNIDSGLMDVLALAMGLKSGHQPPSQAAMQQPQPQAAPQPAPQPRPQPAAAPSAAAPAGPVDKDVEKAKRLSRTVLSDIDLYSPEKVLEAVKAENFQTVFAEELREGLKHYQNRISQDVRSKGNFFQLAIDEFIAKKKKILGIS